VSQPRLLDRVREEMRLRHYSLRTEKTYSEWIKRYILFHDKRHPSGMGETEITTFLTWLATDRKVAASTQNQALAALLFLYKNVLGVELDWLDGIVRARRPVRVPVVLTKDEVRARPLDDEGHEQTARLASLWHRDARQRGAAAQGIGYRFRLSPDRHPFRQGKQGSRHRAAR